MGTYRNLKRRKLNPWFCVVCDLMAGTAKLPLAIDDDPHPDVHLLDIMILDSTESARLYVRAPSARAAKATAKRQLLAYMQTREKRKKDAVAA